MLTDAYITDLQRQSSVFDLPLYDPDDGEYEDEEDFDCHMDRNGNCGKAGSEDCDFECPYRDLKKN